MFGALVGVPPLAALLLSGSALVAWDLDGLEHRLCQVGPDPRLRSLQKRHVIVLAAVVLPAVAVAGTAMLVNPALEPWLRPRSDFWFVFGTVSMLVVCLSAAFRHISQGASPSSQSEGPLGPFDAHQGQQRSPK
jgi:hypothetical protein